MNNCIQTLNTCGESFLSFAWPMLWQSSLLIVVIFALDWMFAQKIRASVRYALWMVVLVKLLLPPALALPTGATWWLWRAQPPIPAAPVVKNYTVSFDETVLPDNYVPPAIPIVLPSPKLSGEAWILIAGTVVSAGLLMWLAFRWGRVAGKVRRAEACGISVLKEAQQLAGLREGMRLRLMDEPLSPAVYGLFRPVILLPRALVEKLSARQLSAVLLHEAIHLQRGDVWVNCAQALLQIFYWWHPLLWFANARIRRVREEAVDDAVMAALRADADAYAPTLLEAAKFAFRRPIASLGLVGILESRSALRQRIERLVDFRPPRRAGITFLSLCGIFIFSAVALPMGQGPASTMDSFSTDAGANGIATNMIAATTLHRKTVQIQGEFFWMTAGDLRKITADAAYHPQQKDNPADWTADARQFNRVEKQIKLLGLKPFIQPRIKTGDSSEADMYCGTRTNWIDFDCDPNIYAGGITLTFKAESDSVSTQGLLAVTNRYEVDGKETVGDNGGLIVRTENAAGSPTNLVVLIRVKTVEEIPAAGSTPASPDKQKANELEHEGHKLYDSGNFADAENDFASALALGPANADATRYWLHMATMRSQILNIHLDQFGPYDKTPLRKVVQDLSRKATNAGAAFNIRFRSGTGIAGSTNTVVTFQGMKDASLAIAFEEIVQGASQPTIYSIESNVEFSTGPERNLEMRTFKVETNTFFANLEKATGQKTFGTNVHAFLKQLIENKGVDLSPPKQIFYNDGLGIVFVYATPQDLDVIERAIQVLNEPPVLVHIRYRFFEVPKAFFTHPSQDYIPAGVTNGIGVMPNPDYQVFLHELEQKGTEVGMNSGGSTLSGQQMEMRADDPKMVYNAALDAYEYEEQGDPALVLDVIPHVMADGYTIDVQAAAYQEVYLPAASNISNATNFVHKASVFGRAVVEVPWAGSSVHRHLYDGQTMILYAKPNEKLRGMSDKELWNDKDDYKDKMRIVLVTAMLIDSAGNRVHSDEELPFAQTGFPPQSP